MGLCRRSCAALGASVDGLGPLLGLLEAGLPEKWPRPEREGHLVRCCLFNLHLLLIRSGPLKGYIGLYKPL